jgi:antitoxin VapB
VDDIAKLFWSGRSQAVRLPKAFRFDAEAVQIRREGRRVILEPIGNRVDDIAAAEADALAAAREAVRQGYASGDAEDWDLERARSEGLTRLEAERQR